MAHSRSSQQYPSNYALVTQIEPPLQTPSPEPQHTQFLQLSHESDTVSSIHEDDQDAYELSTRQDPHRNSSGPSRSISTATRDDQQKDPRVSVQENSVPRSPRKEWKSWKIGWLFNTAFVLVEIGFIVVILVLDQISVHHDGFTTVPDVDTETISSKILVNVRQYSGLLWTSLPAFIFSLYGLTFAAIVAACYEREPFIELRRGGTVRCTIMLDYRAYPGFYNWVVAFMRRHLHLGCAMFLSFVLSIIVAPLSSHLLVASTRSQPSNIDLNFTSRYDDSISIATTSLQPFIDIATAVHAYGATPPAWMTAEYAFVPFSTQEGSAKGAALANISTTTDAYSAYLDCMAVDSRSYTATYRYVGIKNGFETGALSVGLSDRSCSVSLSLDLPVSNSTPIYSQSWEDVCSDGSGSRVGLLAGIYSPSAAIKLTNFSLISCIPSYWRTTGRLNVSLSSASLTSNYISFMEQNSTIISPSPRFATIFEHMLQQFFTFDASANRQSDAFGNAILSAAKRTAQTNAASTMDTELLLNSTERVFTTLYAGLATSQLLVPTQSAGGGTGILSQVVTRLFVARSIAHTIVAVLLSVLFSHIALWIYSARHESVLIEDPNSLLGNAIHLERSDVDHILNMARTSTTNSNLRTSLKKRYNVDQARCYWDTLEDRIKVLGLAEK